MANCLRQAGMQLGFFSMAGCGCCSQLGLEGSHIDIDELQSFPPLGCLHDLLSILLNLAQLRLVLQKYTHKAQ